MVRPREPAATQSRETIQVWAGSRCTSLSREGVSSLLLEVCKPTRKPRTLHAAVSFLPRQESWPGPLQSPFPAPAALYFFLFIIRFMYCLLQSSQKPGGGDGCDRSYFTDEETKVQRV